MHFSPRAATSIDLHIHETARWSRYADDIRVFTEAVAEPFADVEVEHWQANASTCDICELITGYEPDAAIVHQHLPTAAALALALPQTPTALIRHNFQKPPRNAISGVMKRRQFARLARIAFVSECCVEDFRQRWPGVQVPLCTVLNGVDSRLWRPDPVKERLVLFVGRMAPEKGALEAAEAMGRALRNAPGWRGVLVAGTADGHRGYAKRVSESIDAAEGRIALHTDLSHGEVRDLAARAAIALAPTQNREPFGRVAVEAMASGAALIASARGGFVEIVGEDGLLLEEPDAPHLAEAILRLIRDDTLRCDLAARGRERVTHCYDLSESVKSFDAMVADLLDSKR